MSTPYEIAFKYEILNEVIAHVDGLIGRAFPDILPADIAPLCEEVWEIYRKIQLERNIDVLEKYDKRLLEIRDYAKRLAENSGNQRGEKPGADFSDISDFSEAELERELERFYDLYKLGKTPSTTPAAYLLGGQSGSGKSVLHHIFFDRDANLIVIDGDRFRERHPRFREIQARFGSEAANYTQPFVNKMVEALIERLSGEGYGLIIEGTCRSASVPLKTRELLKRKGYAVTLAVMCTSKEKAWNSAAERYREMELRGLMPRAVPREKYEQTVAALPENISALWRYLEFRAFDDILLFNRSGEQLYSLKDRPERDPGEIFGVELNK